MLINNVTQSLASLYAGKSSNGISRNSATERKSLKDEVVFSSEAQSFSALLQKARGMDEVRQEKVDYFQQKIADGSYSVSAQDLAGKLLTRF